MTAEDKFLELAKTVDLGPQGVRQALYGDTHNSRGRGRSDAEKAASYQEYRERKKKVVEYEKRNTRHLVLYAASDVDTNKSKFYNMGGTSAIIFVHEIAPRIGRKTKLRYDMDQCNPNEKFYAGVCSVMDVEALAAKLAEIGIKRARTKDDKILMFKLNREYPHSEVKEMLRAEQERIENLNKLIYSQVLYPDIHRQIIELKKMVPAKVKNMDKTYREIIGLQMIDSLMTMIRAYSQMAHGDTDALTAGKTMMLETDMMLAEISLYSELKLWDISACARIAECIVRLRQLVMGKIINKAGKEGK